jgi:hypothetical protein
MMFDTLSGGLLQVREVKSSKNLEKICSSERC